MKPPVPVPAALLLGRVDAGVVLVGLQVMPVFDEFAGLELMRRYQVAIFAA